MRRQAAGYPWQHPCTTSLHSRKRLCLLHVIANHRLATAETLQSFACHCEERGGCTATWQSVPLRQHKTESNTLGKFVPATISPKVLLSFAYLCGEADCHVAPLLAMTCRRLARVRIMPGYCRGAAENVLAPAHSYPPFACHCVLALAKASLSSACHCEPPPCNRRNPTVFCLSLRGAGRLHRDVAIRSPCSRTERKATLRANP